MKRKHIVRKIKGGLRRVQQYLPVTKTMPGALVHVPCVYNVDSPTDSTLDSKSIRVHGWLVPNAGHTVQGMRIYHNGIYIDLPYGVQRADVERAFPDRPSAQTLYSGFLLDMDVVDGPLRIEVDLGSGYKKIHEIELRYSPEKLVADLYNPNLATNWAEHQNLVENKKRYFYEEASKASYERADGDPRLVAFYLPQYHPLKANDLRFGKGFTEWTNVTGATPRFVGHQQPVLPRDFGFYDLRLDSVIEDQIVLAKQHGVYGFCFYYYWFSGRHVLDRPLNSFIQHKEWDFNFMICWANENWTKQWDGGDRDVFIAQEYLPEDPLKFIKDVEHILLDPRYIREDGKPILAVYRPLDLKETDRYVRTWREYFRKQHKLELHLVSMMSFDDQDPKTFDFDKAIDFAPQTTFFKNDIFEDGKYPYLDVSDKLIDKFFGGTVADYRKLALNPRLYDTFDFPTYKSVIPAWDNDPRQNKRKKGFVCHYTNPDLYGHWLTRVLELEAKDSKSPLVFINAWNEWGEGAILEPSLHQGHAILNRTTEVLAAYSGNKRNRTNFPLYGITKNRAADTAVVVHLYYPETWEYIKSRLANLGDLKYDLFVTLSIKDEDFAGEIRAFNPKAEVVIVPNRGRDVLPFVHIARRLARHNYQYVLKLHAKRSKHRQDGANWFEELVGSLLPSTTGVRDIIAKLEKDHSIVGPKGHYLSLRRYMGGNEHHLQYLLGEVHGKQKAAALLHDADNYGYFGGTMFWAHMDTLRPLLDLYLMPEDFQSEQGQIDGTLAHGIERALSLLPQMEGKPLYQVSANGKVTKVKSADIERGYAYAP